MKSSKLLLELDKVRQEVYYEILKHINKSEYVNSYHNIKAIEISDYDDYREISVVNKSIVLLDHYDNIYPVTKISLDNLIEILSRVEIEAMYK